MEDIRSFWKSLPEWAKPIIPAALLGLLSARYYGSVRLIHWLTQRRHQRVDDAILDVLRQRRLIGLTASEIAGLTKRNGKDIEAGIRRLEKEGRIHYSSKGRWVFGTPRSGGADRFSPRW
jgi:hypothetical protein